MKVNEVEEREDGSALVQGELSKEQLAFLVNLGLNVVLRAGAGHLKVEKPEDKGAGLVVPK